MLFARSGANQLNPPRHKPKLFLSSCLGWFWPSCLRVLPFVSSCSALRVFVFCPSCLRVLPSCSALRVVLNVGRIAAYRPLVASEVHGNLARHHVVGYHNRAAVVSTQDR